MSSKTKLFIDIIERATATWAEAFLGLLLVANVWTSTQAGTVVNILQVGEVAAVAAVPAGLAVLKGGLSSLLGNRDSAAALPADAS